MVKQPLGLKKYNKESTLSYVALAYGVVLMLVLISECVRNFSNNIKMFTNWTNFFCACWLIMYGISFFCNSKKFEDIIRNKNIVISIVVPATITFLIVAFVLFPFWKGEFIAGITGATFFTHFFTIIIVWIIYGKMKLEGKWNWKSNFYVLCFPLVWAFIVVAIGLATKQSFIPYDFLKPDTYAIAGAPAVVEWLIYAFVILMLAAVFYGLGYGFIVTKKKVNILTKTNTTKW